MTPLHGVLPVLHMPYHDNFEVDYDTLAAEVDFAYECGAHGIVMAMVTELLRLSTEERNKVAAFLAKTNAGRGSVTISVGAETTRGAIDYARAAADAGATALMAIPPIATGLGESALHDYYAAILNATPLPLVVQDASSYVGKPLTAKFQAELRQELGERVYFKPEAEPVGPVITAMHAITGGNAKIYEGSGGKSLVENYRRGIAGTMPGADLLDFIVALWNALEAGDEDRIYAIAPLIAMMQTLVTSLDGYLAIEKHLMLRRGVFKNTLVREPIGFTLDEHATAEVDRIFDRLQAVL